MTAAQPTPERPATNAPARPSNGASSPAKDAVVLSGRGGLKTRPFTLAGGAYTVAWQAAPSGSVAYFSGRLTPVEASIGNSFVSAMLESRDRGQTEIYGIKSGQHYLDITMSGEWTVAIVPQGQDAVAALDSGPTVAGPAAPPPASPTNWVMAFDKMEASEGRIVSNEAGVRRQQMATGTFQRIYFRVRNLQKQSSSISSSAFTLVDAQGRTYNSDFELRQVLPGGGSSEFGGASIAPDATVALNLTFDVARDATGLVLKMKGGNEVKVN
jgi:hypothetical protein